jgi:hypothetical protein
MLIISEKGQRRSPMLFIWVCFLSLSCNKGDDTIVIDTGDVPVVTVIEWEYKTISSPTVGDGFGTSLALSDDGLYIGAPHGESGGVIYKYNDNAQLDPVMEGEVAGALGAAIAFYDGALYGAAPIHGSGAGAIFRSDGVSIVGDAGQLLGKRLYNTGGGLYAASTSGLFQVLPPTLGAIVQRLNLEFVDQATRAGGLVADGDSLYIGTPHGEVAVAAGVTSLEHSSPLDESGYALCKSNLLGDDRDEIVVGAPGANRVEIYTASDTESLELAKTIQGEYGRFGHAVSCIDGLLIVGAPLFGDEQQGALWRFEGDSSLWTVEETFLSGGNPWAQLGFEIALGNAGEVYAGAPGGQGTVGTVTTYSPITP